MCLANTVESSFNSVASDCEVGAESSLLNYKYEA